MIGVEKHAVLFDCGDHRLQFALIRGEVQPLPHSGLNTGRKTRGVNGEAVLLMYRPVRLFRGNGYGKDLALFPPLHSLLETGDHLSRPHSEAERMPLPGTIKFTAVGKGSHIMHNHGIAIFYGHETLPARRTRPKR